MTTPVLWNMDDVYVVLYLIQKVSLCLGQVIDKISDSNRIVEQWSFKGNENSNMLCIRSPSCQRIVPVTAKNSVCKNCQQMLYDSKRLTSSTVPVSDEKAQPSSCSKPETEIASNVGKPANAKVLDVDKPQNAEACNVEKPTTAASNIDHLLSSVNETELMQRLFPGANSTLLTLLLSQKQCLEKTGKHTRTRRWDRTIIQSMLSLWIRSPVAYRQLRESNLLFLPSEQLLQKYKNCYSSGPGINNDTLQWMSNEASKHNYGTSGGLLIDEMSIQEDICMEFKDGSIKMTGLLDMGDVSDSMRNLTQNTTNVRLATHILQLVFLGYDGFRFPFVYYCSDGATCPELFFKMWESIYALKRWGFDVDYVSLDGASANRSLIKAHFKGKDPASVNFTVPSTSANALTFIMDFSHVIKRVRNNILNSGTHPHCTRICTVRSKQIVWDHWIKCYHWDRATNPMRVNQHLTDEHIFLTQELKMRNHLAEQVLNDDMLHLFEEYQKSLPDGSILNASIELLRHTSVLIKNFRDPRPIIDFSDDRLRENRSALKWFEEWENEGKDNKEPKSLMSQETRDDLRSTIIGFEEVCKRRISVGSSVCAAGINSDAVENIFCQQRSQRHGSNSNPTAAQYRHGLTATILTQSSVSKKSNAYARKRSAEPLVFSSPKPLHAQKKVTTLRI